MTGYKAREIAGLLADALGNMPVVVVSGLRQTGKSTLLVNEPILRKRRYFTLDDFNTLEAFRRNPEQFLNTQDDITIDEVQKLPEIMTVIKRMVDKKRRPGQFLLSGSANLLLFKNIAESLAGRAVYLTLYPFTRREISGATKQQPALVHFINKGVFPKRDVKPITGAEIIKGGMPSVCLGEVRKPDIWFRGYEQTYLERDIRALSQVADLGQFRNLLQLLSLRNGQILKQSELARDAKLNVMTASRYLSLLETSFVIMRLLPYLRNRSSRLIKSPKIYITDSGLACYLAGIKNLNANMLLGGAIWENYTAQNLQAILVSHYPESTLAYWSVQGRYEVDFILEIENETIAIEVKSGSRWQNKDLAGLKTFLSTSPKCRAGILAYNGQELLKLGDKLWAVPLHILLA